MTDLPKIVLEAHRYLENGLRQGLLGWRGRIQPSLLFSATLSRPDGDS